MSVDKRYSELGTSLDVSSLSVYLREINKIPLLTRDEEVSLARSAKDGCQDAKDKLIQAMGILFTVSTLVLGLALGGQRLISADLGMMSLLGIVPALIGMAAGQVVRQRMSEERFRTVLFVALLVLGFYIIYRALG